MKNRLFIIIATTIALGCITACSQDDAVVFDESPKTPISFNVGFGILPSPDVSTRGYTTTQAVGGYTFSGGEYMAIAVTGKGVTTRSTTEVVKQYSISAGNSGNNALTYQKDADGTSKTDAYHWLSNTETVSIRAWSDGKTTTPAAALAADPDGQAFTIESTQSGDVKELLYSPAKDYTNSDTNSDGIADTQEISLYHQLSRIVVNVKDDADGSPTIAAISIGHDSDGHRVPKTGTFAKPTSGNNYGTWSGQTNLGTITPKLETTATSGYEHTYTAVVIPGGTTFYPAGMKLINITIGGENFSYTIPAGGITLNSGKQYNYNITVKNRAIILTISVTAWTNDARSIDFAE